MLRYAPSYVMGAQDVLRARGAHPYTVQTVAKFIGWLKPSGEMEKDHRTMITDEQIEKIVAAILAAGLTASPDEGRLRRFFRGRGKQVAPTAMAIVYHDILRALRESWNGELKRL